MKKIFFLAHKAGHFESDFFTCGTYAKVSICDSCKGEYYFACEPLTYFWDFDFGSPLESLASGHQFFWNVSLGMVTQRGYDLLRNLTSGLNYKSTEFVKHDEDGSPNRTLPADDDKLLFLCAKQGANVAESNPNGICQTCGKFTRKPVQRSSLKVDSKSIPDSGVFFLRENWDPNITFITEEVKKDLDTLRNFGLGIYPAGRAV